MKKRLLINLVLIMVLLSVIMPGAALAEDESLLTEDEANFARLIASRVPLARREFPRYQEFTAQGLNNPRTCVGMRGYWE